MPEHFSFLQKVFIELGVCLENKQDLVSLFASAGT